MPHPDGAPIVAYLEQLLARNRLVSIEFNVSNSPSNDSAPLTPDCFTPDNPCRLCLSWEFVPAARITDANSPRSSMHTVCGRCASRVLAVSQLYDLLMEFQQNYVLEPLVPVAVHQFENALVRICSIAGINTSDSLSSAPTGDTYLQRTSPFSPNSNSNDDDSAGAVGELLLQDVDDGSIDSMQE